MPVPVRLALGVGGVAMAAAMWVGVAGMQGAAPGWGLAMVAGTALVLGLWLHLTVARPLRLVLEQARVVASGQRAQALLLERRDEIGALMRSVEQAGLNMKSLVGDIQVKAQRVLSAAAGLVEEHARLSDRCAQAAASLEETAASMEEIQAGMEATMQGIDAAGDLARRCAGQAIDSQRQVDQVVDAMGHITEASQRIGEITVLIDGIAFQTNVLALNAAVEAARAGEHGRGFAVVAGEVRSLSRRSVEAAREIRQLIQACGEAVAQGQREAAQAGATMAAVVGGVRELDAVMAGLRLAGHQQSAGVAQVGEAIAALDRVTQDNAALAEHGTRSLQAMTAEARRLHDAALVFCDGGVDQPASAPSASSGG